MVEGYRIGKGSILCVCQDCGERHFVRRKMFSRAAPPRCVGCGGRLRQGSAFADTVERMDAVEERLKDQQVKQGIRRRK